MVPEKIVFHKTYWGGGSGGSGNEVVWLESPQEILPRQTSITERTVSLEAAGYPANIIRVLLKVNPETTCSGWDPPTCWTSSISIKQTIAGQVMETGLANSWITINNQLLVLKVSSSASAGVKGDILAYECQGQCLPGTMVGTCQVEIGWDIGGYTGSKVVTMGQYDKNYLAMDYEGRGTGSPGMWRYYDELVASRGWDRGACNWSIDNKAGYVGYMNPFIMNLYKTTFDASVQAEYAELNMTPGSTASLNSLLVPGSCGLVANTVQMSAEVLSCTN